MADATPGRPAPELASPFPVQYGRPEAAVKGKADSSPECEPQSEIRQHPWPDVPPGWSEHSK
jgi:hypothetical protein